MSEPLTDEQITDLERKIGQLPTIKKLKDNDNKIIEENEKIITKVNEIEKGQGAINVRLDKGDRRMGAIELAIGDLKSLVVTSNKELITAINDDKFSRFEAAIMNKDREIDRKEKELDKEKEFWGKIKSGVILLSISSAAAYVLWSMKVFAGKA